MKNDDTVARGLAQAESTKRSRSDAASSPTAAESSPTPS